MPEEFNKTFTYLVFFHYLLRDFENINILYFEYILKILSQI